MRAICLTARAPGSRPDSRSRTDSCPAYALPRNRLHPPSPDPGAACGRRTARGRNRHRRRPRAGDARGPDRPRLCARAGAPLRRSRVETSASARQAPPARSVTTICISRARERHHSDPHRRRADLGYRALAPVGALSDRRRCSAIPRCDRGCGSRPWKICATSFTAKPRPRSPAWPRSICAHGSRALSAGATAQPHPARLVCRRDGRRPRPCWRVQSTLTIAVDIALALIFLGWSGLRVLAMLLSSTPHYPPARRGDDDLPLYSIIVAIYREAEFGAGTGRRADRASIIRKSGSTSRLVVECDDMETRLALDLMDLGAPFEIVIAPSAGPRTKPKALNAALPFVRGRYVAIFDAEDRPEPQQLRIALSAFEAGDPKLACVQARLTIDNTADNWLTRLFTAEYAGCSMSFCRDSRLGGCRCRWAAPPIISRRTTLRSLGGWDPYNVTEDADLGIRLARAGYHTDADAIVDLRGSAGRPRSVDQAAHALVQGLPANLGRAYARAAQAWRELGPGGFLVFQLVIGGAVLAALVHGVFAVELAGQFASGLLWAAQGQRLRSGARGPLHHDADHRLSALGAARLLSACRGAGCCAARVIWCCCRSTGCCCRSPPGAPCSS